MIHAADYQSVNKALWNERVGHHLSSGFYDMDAFRKGGSSLNWIEQPLLGEVRGKDVLHLQCHFGQDTLSLARLGARATGLDFSDAAIDTARQLADELQLPASFICSDVYEAANRISGPVDIVFASYGVVGWLPDLERWARVVADCLKPGGCFVFAEFHPMVWMYNETFTDIAWSYFNRQPIIETEEATYADGAAQVNLPSVGWNHSLGEVLGSLLATGLRIDFFGEYDRSPYPIFRNTVEPEKGKYQVAGLEGKLPLVYALKAVRP